MQGKAVVVFSGGQDSTTCLFWALQKFRRGHRGYLRLWPAAQTGDCMRQRNCRRFRRGASYFRYGTAKPISTQCADQRRYRCKAGEDGQLPNTFVEGRNMLFLTFAGVLAKVKGAKHIVTGVCETDFSGYPDCRDVFIKSLNVTMNLAMDYEFVIHTPLMWIDKAETWALADQLGRLDYVREKTLTCYNGIKGDGCGECPSCKLRRHGLETYLAQKAGNK